MGEIKQDGSKISIESGASSNSSGIIESKQGLRYRAGKSFEGKFTAIFSSPEVGNTRSVYVVLTMKSKNSSEVGVIIRESERF